MSLGYSRPLYLLPFDHRHSYITGMCHFTPPLTPQRCAAVTDSKQVIYDVCRAAVATETSGSDESELPVIHLRTPGAGDGGAARSLAGSEGGLRPAASSGIDARDIRTLQEAGVEPDVWKQEWAAIVERQQP